MCRLVLPLLLFACNEHTLGVSNAVPQVTFTSHLPGDTVYDGIPFVVRAVGSDADSPPPELVAQWSVAGEIVELCSGMPLADDGGTECTVQLAADTETPRVQIEVRDADGAVGTAAVDLEVVQQQEEVGDPPVVTLLSPQDGGTSHGGEALLFEADVSDVQDSPWQIALTWTSDVDGEFSSQGPDSSGKAQFVYAGLSPGQHVITVRATDSEGQFTTDLATWRINGVPSAPVVSITPEDPSSTADLQAVLDSPGLDPEGLAVSHTWEWLRDGIVQPQTSSLVLGTDTARGELWTVRVYPHDSDGGTGPYGEASVTIRNAPPVVQQAVLSPDPAYTNDVLAVVATAEDSDGDAVTFTRAWTVNGLPAGSGAETLDGSVAFQRGDTVQVHVTANDGSEDSVPLVSNEVIIANSPPSAPSVTLAPLAPIELQDDLYCSASGSSDPDGDAVDYLFSWSVDGASYPDADDQGPFSTVWPDDTADALDTTAGEQWTCEVAAVDPQGLAGLSASASVVIESEVFVPDYDGTFDLDPDLSYRCAFGLVDLDVTQLTFSSSGATLSVSGGPQVLTGPLPTDENFTAQGVIAGGCTETYTISGTFQDEDHFVGTFTLSFTGAQCGLTNCTNQAWPVDGYRL